MPPPAPERAPLASPSRKIRRQRALASSRWLWQGWRSAGGRIRPAGTSSPSRLFG